MIVVDIAFSTSQVGPSERLPAWRDLVNRAFLPLTIAPLLPGEFHGSVNGSDRGELRVWRVRASPMSAVRAEHHIRSSGCDDYLLALHVTGTAVAAQDGRQVTLGPGDFALTVAEVAASWGFRSAAYFSRAFHARYGRTPAEVRRASRPSQPEGAAR